MSPLLFLLVINWIMKKVTENRECGIKWLQGTQLDDLDYADDLALLSHGLRHMQIETKFLEEISRSIQDSILIKPKLRS